MQSKIKKTLPIIQSVATVQKHFQKYPPVFIIGSPRSGTTLTLKLFQNQPQITALFEPWELWRKAFRLSADDSYSHQVTPWVLPQFSYTYLKYLYYSKILSNQPYLVSKDPRDSIRVETINKIFPNAKFIHIIRDGRDVISSTMKTFQNPLYRNGWYFDSDNWLHVRIPNYQEILQEPSHIKAAIQWKYCVETSLKHLENIPADRQILFHYEDLISHPEEVTTKIFKFACPEVAINQSQLQAVINSISDQVIPNNQLDLTNIPEQKLPWSEKLKQFSSLVKNDAGSGTTAAATRVGRWQKDLDETILSECDQIIGELMQSLGYL